MKRRTRGKRSKSKSNRASSLKTQATSPKTAAEFFALTAETRQVYLNVLELIARMREKGISRTRATRELKLTSRQVDRFGRSALRKLKNGRYVAKAHDHLLRVVVVIAHGGLLEIGTVDSRQAGRAGRHSAAVHKYVQTGDASALAQFKGKYIIDAGGEQVELLTDPEELDQLGSAGVLSFESLYAKGL